VQQAAHLQAFAEFAAEKPWRAAKRALRGFCHSPQSELMEMRLSGPRGRPNQSIGFAGGAKSKTVVSGRWRRGEIVENIKRSACRAVGLQSGQGNADGAFRPTVRGFRRKRFRKGKVAVKPDGVRRKRNAGPTRQQSCRGKTTASLHEPPKSANVIASCCCRATRYRDSNISAWSSWPLDGR
jgi:hypothetical protein